MKYTGHLGLLLIAALSMQMALSEDDLEEPAGDMTWKEEHPSCERPPFDQLTEPKIGLPAFASKTSAADLVASGQTSLATLQDLTTEVTIFSFTDSPSIEAFDAALASDDKAYANAAVGILVVAGKVLKADMVDGAKLTTFGGAELTVGVKDNEWTLTGPVNTVTINRFNRRDCNSIIHVTDAALQPLDPDCVYPFLEDSSATRTGLAFFKSDQTAAELEADGKAAVAALQSPAARVTIFQSLRPADVETLDADLASDDASIANGGPNALVVAGQYLPAELTDGKQLLSFGGYTLTVSVVDGVKSITGPTNTVKLTGDFFKDCNSVVHMTDVLLEPSVSAANPGCTYAMLTPAEGDLQIGLAQLASTSTEAELKAAGQTALASLQDRKIQVTLFSFTDEASLLEFENTLSDPESKDMANAAVNVLAVAGQFTKADLVDGAKLTTFSETKLEVSITDDVYTIIGPVNNVTITQFDIRDCNSIVHVTDSAILPLDPACKWPYYSKQSDNQMGLAMFQSAESDSVLKSEGKLALAGLQDPKATVTVFGTDSKTSLATLRAVMKGEDSDAANEAVNILVVAGTYMFADLKDDMELETFGGKKLTVAVADGVTTITGPGNTVTITKPDITDCNSVVHLTDATLSPTVVEVVDGDATEEGSAAFGVQAGLFTVAAVAVAIAALA